MYTRSLYYSYFINTQKLMWSEGECIAAAAGCAPGLRPPGFIRFGVYSKSLIVVESDESRTWFTRR